MSGNPLSGNQCGKPDTRYKSVLISSANILINASSNWTHYIVDDSFDELTLTFEVPITDSGVFYGMSVMVTLNRSSLVLLASTGISFKIPDGFSLTNLPDNISIEFIFSKDNSWVLAPWGVASTAFHVGEEPPTQFLVQGARWYKPSEATTYIYYCDVDGCQWVQEPVANTNIESPFLTPAMFGIKSDGSDQSSNLQALFDSSQGKIVVLPSGQNYRYNQFEIKPGTTLITNGSVFTRLVPSTTHGIVIRDNVTIDRLVVFSPGGSSGDKAILLTGGNFKADRVSVRADAEGTFTSTNWAFEIDAGGSTITNNVDIGSFQTRNYRNSMFAKRVTGLKVRNIKVDFYQIAFYLQDCQDVDMNGATIGGQSTTLTGNPGENGILIESTSANASRNIRISNWRVSDSGEHGYRLGGQFTISDVYFTNCVSIRPGKAGYVAWPLATEWHGGCGFKVLGGTTIASQRHKNIHFDNCTVIDCDLNQSFGIGHGVNNFTAFNVFVAEDVFIKDCKVKNSGAQAFSALQGLIIGATNNIHISNFDCDATQRSALRLHDEPPTALGWEFGINGLYINGASFKAQQAYTIVIYADDAKYPHTDWKLKGVNCYGARSALRFETPTTGSYPSDAEVELTYQDSDSDEGTVTTPVISGSTVFRGKITAPWRIAAANPSLKNGSIYTDTITGDIRIRKSGSWTTL